MSVFEEFDNSPCALARKRHQIRRDFQRAATAVYAIGMGVLVALTPNPVKPLGAAMAGVGLTAFFVLARNVLADPTPNTTHKGKGYEPLCLSL